MIDEETVEYILRQLETQLADNFKKLGGCGEKSQSYKHGYREGYKDCTENFRDFLEDLVNGYVDDTDESEGEVQ